jgi:hypothetical protein
MIMTMSKSQNKNAQTHGAYGQILAPLKKNARFEKLHRKLIQHFLPTGPVQHAIVRELAEICWQKRKFDRWHAREFSALLGDLNAGEEMRLREPDDLDEKIADVERDFNEKYIKLAKRAVVVTGKHAERIRTEIAALEQARGGALAPLHASRERQRLEREDSPPLRKLERIEKAKASMDARYDRCLRRLAITKTFDELHASKLIDHRPTKSPIIAIAERTNAKPKTESDRDNDDVDYDVSLAPYRDKKSSKSDDRDDW